MCATWARSSQLVAFHVLLVIDLLLVLCHLGALPELCEIQGCVIHGPALGHDVPGLILLEIACQFRVGSFDLGLQIVRFDEHVIDFDLLTTAQVFPSHLILGDRDAIRHELLEFLLQQLLFHFRLEFRHRHLKARLDFGRVFVHADKSVAGIRRREQFPEEIGVFLVRDAQTQPVRFELQAPLENELIQHLIRVQRAGCWQGSGHCAKSGPIGPGRRRW